MQTQPVHHRLKHQFGQCGRFLAILNSGLFLWLLSAILLTVGGGYIANHKQCFDEATRLIQRRRHLGQELFHRDMEVAGRILQAKSFREYLEAETGNSSSGFPDLASLDREEIADEYRSIADRTSYPQLNDTKVDGYVESWQKFDAEFANKAHQSNSGPAITDLKHIIMIEQAKWMLEGSRQSFLDGLDRLAFSFRPDCSVFNTTSIALGYEAKIIRASINARYPINRDTLLAGLAQVEQGQQLLTQIYAAPELPPTKQH